MDPSIQRVVVQCICFLAELATLYLDSSGVSRIRFTSSDVK
jgi:hypothetical protein